MKLFSIQSLKFKYGENLLFKFWISSPLLLPCERQAMERPKQELTNIHGRNNLTSQGNIYIIIHWASENKIPYFIK